MASPLKYTSGAVFPDKVSWHCRNTKAPETPICRQLKRERTLQHTQGWVRNAKQQQERSGAVVPYKVPWNCKFQSAAQSLIHCLSCTLPFIYCLLYIASLIHCLLYIASLVHCLFHIASLRYCLLYIAFSYCFSFVHCQLAIESCNTRTKAARL